MTDQPSSQAIAINTCRAMRGVSWWKNAFGLLRRYPLQWWLLGLGYLLCLNIPAFIFSELGSLIHFDFLYLVVTIIQPCFVIGLVSAAWNQVKKTPPKFTDLFNGFKADVKTLLGIGLSIAVLSLIWVGICQLIWGQGFFMNALRDADSPQSFSALFRDNPNELVSLYLQLCVYIIGSLLIQAAGFFAPLLVTFLRARVADSMVASFKACFINWLSMLMAGLYFLLWFCVFVVVVTLVFVVLSMAFGSLGSVVVVPFLSVALMILLGPLFMSLSFISIFVAYCDIFHPEDKVFD